MPNKIYMPSVAHTAKSEYARLMDGAGNSITSTAGAIDVAIAGTGMDVTQSAHDSLNCNANMQINDADLAFGQSTMAASLPVAIASDQGSLTVDSTSFDIRPLTNADVVSVEATSLDVRPLTSADTVTVEATALDVRALTNADVVSAECTSFPSASATLWSAAAAGAGASSASLDTQNCGKVAIFGNCGTDTPTLTVQASNDDATWYDSYLQAFPDGTNDFYADATAFPARYLRVKTDSALTSITLLAAAKQ